MTLNATLLLTLLVVLLLLSCFFSASETAMMALNRYKLRHLVKKKHRSAMCVTHLLERPDQLLSTILIGNTFTNLMASAIATMLAIHFYGDFAVLPVTLVMAMCVLIFAEIMPKTIAVLYPAPIAFFASWPLLLLLRLLYPLVWLTSGITNGCLRVFRVSVDKKRGTEDLTGEEVRTLVHESTSQLAIGSQSMMLGVLDLGGATVNDIKVPRTEVVGINIDDPWEKILTALANAKHTRLPLYSDNIDNVKGIVHLRSALNLAARNKLDKKTLRRIAEDVYFIPDSTPLNVQLFNFRQEQKRIGLVVDEYGEIGGLVTLDDILEEIVGEFTTGLPSAYKHIAPEETGSFVVDGSITVRELNRRMSWNFSTTGPMPVTLSGRIIEYLETIPETNVCLKLDGYKIEVLQVEENMVKKVRVFQ